MYQERNTPWIVFKGHPLDSALRALKEQLIESTLLSSSVESWWLTLSTVMFESCVISVLCGGDPGCGFPGAVWVGGRRGSWGSCPLVLCSPHCSRRSHFQAAALRAVCLGRLVMRPPRWGMVRGQCGIGWQILSWLPPWLSCWLPRSQATEMMAGRTGGATWQRVQSLISCVTLNSLSLSFLVWKWNNFWPSV